MKTKIITLSFKGFNACPIMRNTFSLIALLFVSASIFANPHLPTKQQIGMFLNSKTCVVLDDNTISYGVQLKDAVKKYWKVTEFEFIDQKEYEKRRFSSKYSFLVLMKEVYDNDPEGVGYNCLNLVMGDSVFNMTNMPELCNIPISYAGDNSVDYGYAIPAFVKFMQKHVKNIQDKHFLISLSGLKYYNGILNLKYNLLLFNKDALSEDANTEEKIKTVYKYPVKLLSKEEIQKELETNPRNTVFNLHVGPSLNAASGKCFEMIFDTDGNLYYYNNRNITNINKDGFTLNDFKNIR